MDKMTPMDPEYQETPPEWQPGTPGYYGTGRLPKPPRSHTGLIVVLLCVMIVANVITVLMLLTLRMRAVQKNTTVGAETETGVTPTLTTPSGHSVEPTEPRTNGTGTLQISAEDIQTPAAAEIYTAMRPSLALVYADGNGGTAIVMTADGYLITNAHTVSGAESITVQLSDGMEYAAALSGMDESSDLAVLKIEPETALQPAEFGDSAGAAAGDTVYVLTDMLGSSVNNSMVELSRNGAAFTVISGFNIPLALTLAMSPAPVKGAELAALINEARAGLTNPNAPVEAAAAPAKKAKAPRHSSGPAKIVLARLDYRLLHGQVVFTWTTKVQAERIIVVDNAAANDDIKKGALKLAKPQGVRLNVFTVERALAKMDKLNTLGERVMFVFGNTAEMLQFCQGYKLDAINLGATANHDGADQVGGKDSSVFFDATQKADVNQLLDMGIKLYVQQTPTYQSVDIDAKL